MFGSEIASPVAELVSLRPLGSNPDMCVHGRAQWFINPQIIYLWHVLPLHLSMAGFEVLRKFSTSN